MKYFLDCEFIEDGKTIDLISIGLIKENGEEYYAINSDCDLSKASDWVKENVIYKLPPKNCMPTEVSPRLFSESKAWKTKEDIRFEVALFCGCSFDQTFLIRKSLLGLWDKFLLKLDLKKPEYNFYLKEYQEKPEFWAYYADYDWVVFCQLFGTMMDLPKGFPFYCKDIKQLCDNLGNPKLPEQGKGEHNALEDARWNKKAYEYLIDVEKYSHPSMDE